MLPPEEIVKSESLDKLFMVSYISQFYSVLRDRKPLGAAPEFLTPMSPNNRPPMSPGKSASLKKSNRLTSK